MSDTGVELLFEARFCKNKSEILVTLYNIENRNILLHDE